MSLHQQVGYSGESMQSKVNRAFVSASARTARRQQEGRWRMSGDGDAAAGGSGFSQLADEECRTRRKLVGAPHDGRKGMLGGAGRRSCYQA